MPDDVFFEHLANCRFPAGNFIRAADSLDYIEGAGRLHDVFGHVPMLAHPVFADYMEAYGRADCAPKGWARSTTWRGYWYTVEFGLTETPKGLRLYWSESSRRGPRACSGWKAPSPNRIGFDLSG